MLLRPKREYKVALKVESKLPAANVRPASLVGSTCGRKMLRLQSVFGLDMSDQAPTWFHSNRYSAQVACEHCSGSVRHESWCITLNPEVSYAYQIVVDPTALSGGDALILNALGVAWTGNLPR